MKNRGAIVVAGALVCTMALSLESAANQRPGETARIAPGDSSGVEIDISANGRYVAFSTSNRDIVSPDTNLAGDVFVHDRATGDVKMVSVTSDGTQGISGTGCRAGIGAESFRPSISASGRYVAFTSFAMNFAVPDTNLAADVFVHDRRTGKTIRASVSSNGSEARFLSACPQGSDRPSISGNGRYVVFESDASNLVAGDTNEASDVFLHDLKTKRTTLISVGPDGHQATFGARTPSISLNGRYVAFISDDLVPDDDAPGGLYVRDLKRDKLEYVRLVENDIPFMQEGGGAGWCCVDWGGRKISSNGRYITFLSASPKLVPNDTNTRFVVFGAHDAFVHDRRTGRTERVSVSSTGGQGHTDNGVGTITTALDSSGRYVLFTSDFNDLVQDDSGGDLDYDVFAYDRKTGLIDWLSVAPDGSEGTGAYTSNGWSEGGSLSANGRFAAFESRNSNLAAGAPDPQGLRFDVFVRDRGPYLGIGSLRASTSGGGLSVEAARGFSIRGFLHLTDGHDDAVADPAAGAELTGATLAHRPTTSDLYIKIELDHMPGPRGTGTAGNHTLVYGMQFTADGTRYEVQAQGTGLTARFGLFRCASTCAEVAQLQGGYGTVGESIVTAVPLHDLGLQDGGTIADLSAYAALGHYGLAAGRVLDQVRAD